MNTEEQNQVDNTGVEVIEERARTELGMIKKGETFYQIIDPPAN